MRAPLEGARVWLVGAPRSVVTDASGRFRMDSVPTGRRAFVVDHPALDSAGLSDVSGSAEVVAGRIARLNLAVPSLRTFVRAACRGRAAPLGRDSGVVFGAVRDAETGVRLARATVVASWLEVDRSGAVLRTLRPTRKAVSDSLGNYYLCSMAGAVGFTAQVGAGAHASGILHLEIGERRVVRHDLWVSRDSLADRADTVVGMRRGLATLIGVVRDEAGRPVPEAQASVQETADSALTDSSGTFRLSNLPSGSQTLLVRRIGYRYTQMALALRSRDTVRVALLVSVVTVLDTLRVTASPWVRRELDELDKRLRGGSFGVVRTTEDLRGIATMDAVFGGLPSLIVQPSSRTGGRSLYTSFGARLCPVFYWVDGYRQDEERVSELRPEDLIAVEFYPRVTLAPMRYQIAGNYDCGVVLFWTRHLQ